MHVFITVGLVQRIIQFTAIRFKTLVMSRQGIRRSLLGHHIKDFFENVTTVVTESGRYIGTCTGLLIGILYGIVIGGIYHESIGIPYGITIGAVLGGTIGGIIGDLTGRLVWSVVCECSMIFRFLLNKNEVVPMKQRRKYIHEK